jgi:hypothetical protein
MLQLATLSARGASEAPDLLITPGCGAAPWLSSTRHRSRFGRAWRSPLKFAISTLGTPAWPIGAGYMIVDDAGYMIVNELALTRLTEHSRSNRRADHSATGAHGCPSTSPFSRRGRKRSCRSSMVRIDIPKVSICGPDVWQNPNRIPAAHGPVVIASAVRRRVV